MLNFSSKTCFPGWSSRLLSFYLVNVCISFRRQVEINAIFGYETAQDLVSEETLLFACEAGLFPSTLTLCVFSLLFQKASPVRWQKFTTQRARCFKVNAVNPDMLLEKLSISLHENSWCWADIKHSCGHKACSFFTPSLLSTGEWDSF